MEEERCGGYLQLGHPTNQIVSAERVSDAWLFSLVALEQTIFPLRYCAIAISLSIRHRLSSDCYPT
jgi:hypothetical protein